MTYIEEAVHILASKTQDSSRVGELGNSWRCCMAVCCITVQPLHPCNAGQGHMLLRHRW
jgi:hypothetical protein